MPTYCPVPAEVPLDWKAVKGPIPTAGPYYIASVEGHRMVLERNPNYHGDRPRRLARIVVWDNIPTPKAIALVEAGQLDYLPHDSLMVIDESHQTIPQLHGMYHGDRSRKETLVAFGFRLPSANYLQRLLTRRLRAGRQFTFRNARPG